MISLCLIGCGKQRLVVAVMGFFVTLTAYTQRLCLSVAITEMVIIPVGNTSETIENELNCPNTNGELNTTQVSIRENMSRIINTFEKRNFNLSNK